MRVEAIALPPQPGHALAARAAQPDQLPEKRHVLGVVPVLRVSAGRDEVVTAAEHDAGVHAGQPYDRQEQRVGQRNPRRPAFHRHAGRAADVRGLAIALAMALKVSGWICMSASTKQRIGAVASAAPPLRPAPMIASLTAATRHPRARAIAAGGVGRCVVGDDHLDRIGAAGEPRARGIDAVEQPRQELRFVVGGNDERDVRLACVL